LNGGVHSLTATYSGNVDFTTANSSLSQRVPDFTLAANPTDVAIHRGQSATIDITGTPLAGFTGQVSITCNNLPQYASCAFNPATTTINGQATVTVLTFNTKAVSHDASAQKFSAFQLASWMLALPGFMGVMFIREAVDAGSRFRSSAAQSLSSHSLRGLAEALPAVPIPLRDRIPRSRPVVIRSRCQPT
jgi:hypothetical protein